MEVYIRKVLWEERNKLKITRERKIDPGVDDVGGGLTGLDFTTTGY